MVDVAKEKFIASEQLIDIPKEDFRWSSVSLSEVLNKKLRLEASVFGIEEKHAREVLKNCKWDLIKLSGDNGYVEKAFYPGRFKRIYIDKNEVDAIGFLGSAEMLDVRPVPIKFLSSKHNDVQQLKIKDGYILLSRSGTIGNLTYVSNRLKDYLISEHAIRIICKEFPGYVYAFLKTKIGQALIKSNIYGAVVDQIEPEHLEEIPIPNPNPEITNQIHQLITDSFDLRDLSNELINEAQNLLISELKLPPIEDLKIKYFDKDAEIRNYQVKLSRLNERIDASYHVPIVDSIIGHIEKFEEEVTTLGDKRISKEIILPGRFKRVYVEEGQGVVFFGGKQLYELDPSNKKYLSLTHHAKRIKEQLTLRENMIMITCSGTIGKVNIVPKHWENWTANQHIIRVVPINNNLAGYIYTWLSSDYGYQLITHFTYGSVVDEIDDNHFSQVQIPLLKNKDIQQQISDLVLEANQKRYEAYILEQKALRIMNDTVIYS